MTADRIKEIQETTAFPNSLSVCQALIKVWNECEYEQNSRMYSEEDIKSAWENGRNGETECIGSYPFYKTVFKNKTFKDWFKQFKKK